jgi:predicted ATPase
MGISPLIEAPHGILDLMTGRPCGANFVGRTQELAQILEAVDRAERGEPGLVLIGGEAGIGKTRLLSDPRLARLSDTTAESALAGLLLTSDVRNPAAPQRAFHTILSLIEKIAKTTTAVLIFEDIQDADSATAALLTFLTRSLRDTRVLLIATYRSGLHRARPRMSQLLADLERQRLTEHMELGRFRRTEVAAQLQALLGREVEEALMQQIYARAEGNPYFTEVLARGLSEPDGALLSSLRDLLISRIYRLPDDTRRILHIIAAGGLEVRHDVLAAVADLPGPRLAEALRPAVTEGVIDLNADHTGYRFHHALAHEAVEQDVLPGERVALHLAFAQALESAGTNASDDNATEIARHLYAAHNIHRAFPMLLRAA